MYGGVEYLTFDILIGNKFCTPITFQNPLKTGFSLRNIFITICVGFVWIVIYISFTKKKAFNGLLKVIAIQNVLCFILMWNYIN